MNFSKRALIHVRANLGKSILIFLIFLVTMGAVSTGFMSKRMYDKTLQETFKDGVVPVRVQPEYPDTVLSGFTYDWNQWQNLSTQQYFDIAELEEVDSSSIQISSTLQSGQLILPSELKGSELDINYVQDPQTTLEENVDEQDIDYQIDYDKDEFKSNPNSIIMSDKVLEANDLEVGDKLTLDLNSEYTSGVSFPEFEDQELTIVGSYTAEPTQAMIDRQLADAEEYGYEPDTTFSYLNTTVYMPLVRGQEMAQLLTENDINVDQQGLWADASYDLKSLDDVAPFEAAVEELTGMPIEVSFDLYGDDANAMASSLSAIQGIQEILNYFLAFGIIVVTVLLTILITLFIRGRKKEIGIMVALGETKRNIYLQLVLEQVIIMAIATISAYPICLIILTALSAKFGFLGLGLTVVPLLQTIVVGAVIIGLITIIPAVYTLRLKPKKILL